LEYRGYDSAGISLHEPGGLERQRAVGQLDRLKTLVGPNGSHATVGTGHTRWATHGSVSVENAHPLAGCVEGEVAVVLNGIVENYRELRTKLERDGHVFGSQTDAEVVAHLLEDRYAGDLAEAVQAAAAQLEGHFAFVASHRAHPELLVGTRRQCPLVVGLGDGEAFLASSISGFLGETRRILHVGEDEAVVVSRSGARLLSATGEVVDRAEEWVDWDDEAAEKAGYETFMLKEIHEQPAALTATLAERVRRGRLELDLGLDDAALRRLRRIVILACGTAYHAGVVARYALEEWTRLPCEPDIASEWR